MTTPTTSAVEVSILHENAGSSAAGAPQPHEVAEKDIADAASKEPVVNTVTTPEPTTTAVDNFEHEADITVTPVDATSAIAAPQDVVDTVAGPQDAGDPLEADVSWFSRREHSEQ